MFLGVGVCLLVLAQGKPATATTINFDDVVDGTIINNNYVGVTFSNPIGSGNVYAQSGGNISSPNVVSILNGGEDRFFDGSSGAVDATFATAQATVSIDVRAVGPLNDFLDALTLRPYLEAYNSANVLIGKVYFAGALPIASGNAFTPFETLTVSSGVSDDIKRVRFSSQCCISALAVYGAFDNLTFNTFASGGGGGSAVPEPASLLLLGAGFAGLVALRRRFQA